MTDEHRMEQLSRAYVQAVAAVCGCTCARPEPDYGHDLTLCAVQFQGGEFTPRGRSLDLQLKSSTAADVTAGEVTFDLSVRAYNLLRRSTKYAPALLVLVLLSPNRDDWLEHAEERLSIRGRAYWLSLRGAPAVANTSTVRVRIPRVNLFTPGELSRIMTVLQQEGDL
jgi:hypothetical protein